jgi:hypothetical protein
MEERIGLIKVPTRGLAGSEDPFSFPCMKRLSERIEGCETGVIRGGMVPMVDQMPGEFAHAVIDFLDRRSPGERGDMIQRMEGKKTKRGESLWNCEDQQLKEIY